jgi:hypothetical protein
MFTATVVNLGTRRRVYACACVYGKTVESIDLCSVHAPGIQTVADRIHEGCGPFSRRVSTPQ